MSVQGGSSAPESYPSIDVKFKIPSFTASGIKVSRLDIHNEVSTAQLYCHGQCGPSSLYGLTAGAFSQCSD